MNERKMTTVKMKRGSSGSRDNSPFLVKNPSVWRALRRGEEVEFPVDELRLTGDLLIDVTTVQAAAIRKPKRVVKDNHGNIWHDGVIVSGPGFDAEQALQGKTRSELSSGERLNQVRGQVKEEESTPQASEETSEEDISKDSEDTSKDSESTSQDSEDKDVSETEDTTEERSPSSDEADDSTSKRRLKRRRKKS